ncbi:hypothetical protein CANTEDRAFT_104061, partial [Yamadazyma tenuis ATCC 10573]
LSEYENSYINQRHRSTQLSLKHVLKRNCIPGFEASQVLDSLSPVNIAIAISGGGYRSMLTAAGVLAAYDSRTPGSQNPGHLGGFLQATSYIAGISGGSWVVMSVAVNDYKPMVQLKDEELHAIEGRLLIGIPDFDPGFKGNSPKSEHIETREDGTVSSVLSYFGFNKKKGTEPRFSTKLLTMMENKNQISGENKIKDIYNFYESIHNQVRSKKKSGSYISFTDYWGRALNQKLFTSFTSRTFSSLKELPSMKSFAQPFPILCAVLKSPIQKETSQKSHLVEFTPEEFGSWDSYMPGFIKTKYLGSTIKNGFPVDGCKMGYDDVGFLVATSSSLFNNVFLYVYNYLMKVNHEEKTAIQTILSTFGLSSNYTDSSIPQHHPDYAIYSPNPFSEYEEAEDSISSQQHMYLADGGDDGQNIPFQPLLQPARNLDLILAFDMSSDLYNFPNGSSLTKTASRFHNSDATMEINTFSISGYKQAVFPKVPSAEQIKQLPNTPMFLGCDLIFDYPRLEGSHIKQVDGNFLPPLLVYTPNRHISYASNTSTFQLSYNHSEINQMFQNGYELATANNSTDFAACISCAAIKRKVDKMHFRQLPKALTMGLDLPEYCHQCLNKYCWHETRISTV